MTLKKTSHREALIFRMKATALQLKRGANELVTGRPVGFGVGQSLREAPVIAESHTSLWNNVGALERPLVSGKIQNLRVAIRRLDGIEVPASHTFSFWRQIGKATRLKGYVLGRELREGCLIPTIGGGLCQLSNALYNVALLANFEIVERHAHTQIIPGSLAQNGGDATVFWNYVDLRFKAPQAFRLEAELTRDSLVIRLRAFSKEVRPNTNPTAVASISEKNIDDCFSCGKHSCFRSNAKSHLPRSTTAYLLDDYWPEFDTYIVAERKTNDILFIPLDGHRFGRSNYAWTTSGFADVLQNARLTLWRSLRSRHATSHGAARQRELMRASERLAKHFASRLSHNQTHLVVMQNLMPYLWREGHLGGRSFDVLMTGLPLSTLNHRLDQALFAHPESTTLGAFRADELLVELEAQALLNARRVITPHSEVASLFPYKAILVNWHIPSPRTSMLQNARPPKFIFPAATLGRKGAYELREAIRDVELELMICGPVLEHEDFWKGMRVFRCESLHSFDRSTVVVLPSLVENRPRRLLSAVGNGLIVVASNACGLINVPGVRTVKTGDVDDLRATLVQLLRSGTVGVLACTP